MNLKTNKIFLGFVSAIIIYIALFPAIGYLKNALEFPDGLDTNQIIIFDAILSFIFLLIFYSYIYLKNYENAIFIVFFSAFLMFLHWCIFSKFFLYGFNPYYPKWYVINVAINELVAAGIVSIFFKAHNKSLNRDATSVAPIS